MHHILYKLKDGLEKSFMLWKVLVKRKYSYCNLLFSYIYYSSSFKRMPYVVINRITMKDIKAFLPRVNCKIATNRLRELFQEVDIRNRNELGFDDFVILYHKLIFDQNVSICYFYT